MAQQQINDNLVLVCGKSATGKSVSLMGLKDPTGVLYLNCESGKKLPFKSKFTEKVITDPLQIYEAFDWLEHPDQAKYHTVVIDTLTYLLEMYVSLYIATQVDGRAAWGNFAQYFKHMMQQKVAACTKNVIFLAHTADNTNEAEMVTETKVPVQGSLKNNGIESYFSCVIAAKKMTIKALKDFANPLLVITDQERALGYKHVFQTSLTEKTKDERLRGPIGMWTYEETYIDNNTQLVLNRLHEYYA